MKKYNKVPNIDLNTCTTEQVIAYNIACSYHDIFLKRYQAAGSDQEKTEILKECLNLCKKDFTTKYNKESVFYALENGIKAYFDLKYHILTSYKQVGEIFPVMPAKA